jgi:hypothetical protein
MQKKIKLEIKDLRDSFGHKNQKEPYYLFIEYGSKSFYFSNEKKAKKWLTQFETLATDFIRELMYHAPSLHENNIILTPYLDLPKLMKLQNELNFIEKRYWILFNNDDISIGREINLLYHHIELQYEFYKDFFRTNNRFTFQYQKSIYALKSLKRLKKEFDHLLISKENTKIKKTIKVTSYLKIA